MVEGRDCEASGAAMDESLRKRSSEKVVFFTSPDIGRDWGWAVGNHLPVLLSTSTRSDHFGYSDYPDWITSFQASDAFLPDVNLKQSVANIFNEMEWNSSFQTSKTYNPNSIQKSIHFYIFLVQHVKAFESIEARRSRGVKHQTQEKHTNMKIYFHHFHGPFT